MKFEDKSQIYMDMIRSIVGEGKDVCLIVSGNSMSPFLKNGRDYILIGPIDRKLNVGDMAFFQNSYGQYVMHRICRVKEEQYYFIGDAQIDVEGPILRNQIFAVVKKVKRNGKWTNPSNIIWRFYSDVWIRIIPFRKYIYKIWKFLVR